MSNDAQVIRCCDRHHYSCLVSFFDGPPDKCCGDCPGGPSARLALDAGRIRRDDGSVAP